MYNNSIDVEHSARLNERHQRESFMAHSIHRPPSRSDLRLSRAVTSLTAAVALAILILMAVVPQAYLAWTLAPLDEDGEDDPAEGAA